MSIALVPGLSSFAQYFLLNFLKMNSQIDLYFPKPPAYEISWKSSDSFPRFRLYRYVLFVHVQELLVQRYWMDYNMITQLLFEVQSPYPSNNYFELILFLQSLTPLVYILFLPRDLALRDFTLINLVIFIKRLRLLNVTWLLEQVPVVSIETNVFRHTNNFSQSTV